MHFNFPINVYAGIVLCLVYNIVAVTVCWIKGEGEFCLTIFLMALFFYFFGGLGHWFL